MSGGRIVRKDSCLDGDLTTDSRAAQIERALKTRPLIRQTLSLLRYLGAWYDSSTLTKGVTPPVYGPTQSTECYSGTRI